MSASALMQGLLTGRVRFKEFEGLEWKVLPIGALGKVVSGGTPDTKNPSYWNGEVFWCTPSEVTTLQTRYISQTERTISKKGLQASSSVLLPPRSLIVCTRATVGDCAINTIPICTNQGFKSIIPNDKVSVEFLYYILSYLKPKLLRLANGSTFLEVSKADFEALELHVPTVEEQEQIANFLNSADAELETLQKQLEAYERQKRGLMQQLLTGKKRVKV